MKTSNSLKLAGRLLLAGWLLTAPLAVTAQQNERAALSQNLSRTWTKTEQAATPSPVHTVACSGTAGLEAPQAQAWRTRVISRQRSHGLPQEILQLKEQKTALKQRDRNAQPAGTENARQQALAPVVGASFEGNWFDGFTPSDNAMAISNGGKIVTTINSNIEYYDANGSFINGNSFDGFFNNSSFTANLYDPKIIYDAQADRFIMVVLHGSTSATSKVIVCFSKTNNPTDGWWTYQLPGNVLNNGTWFDYPNIGISTNEVYITGNLFKDDNLGGSFDQSVIFQVQKTGGYSGGNINYRTWSNISSSPYAAFTIVPVSHGHGLNYGPGAYFVSSSAGGSDKIRLYDLTDDMSGNPQLNTYTISTDAYSPGGYAYQQGSGVELNTGDCRIQSALILNGIVHFAFHADINNSGYNAIYYGRLNLSSGSITSKRFGANGFDYCYPALASASNSASDQTVAFSFLRSGNSIYPELRTVECDNSMTFSNSELVKAGNSYVDVSTSGNKTRWGDYTAAARRYSSNPARVWVAGGFGTTRTINGSSYHCYDTWVGEVGFNITGIQERPATAQRMQVYPNPVYDMFTLDFETEQNVPAEIVVTDMVGRTVKVLFQDRVRKGRNTLMFNKGALPAGTYVVTVKTQDSILKNETLVVQ